MTRYTHSPNLKAWFACSLDVRPVAALYKMAGLDDVPLLSWPPRSPDRAPCDFFLWGNVKDKVYVPPMPTTLQALQERIIAAVTDIDGNMLLNVSTELDYRWDVCRVTKGAHINICSLSLGHREAIRRKRPGILSDGVTLLHDNTHTARKTQELLQKFKWEVWIHLYTAQIWHPILITNTYLEQSSLQTVMAKQLPSAGSMDRDVVSTKPS
ncbi:hypothetical protein AVEN_168823-1 [Araneus ventricosus]|uniref:Uncharacterized protein n=1 Tax=Araneus ventricosus TaxID=182803 RepID=A0A4Y2HTT2_ARAVE|nr:hypothetical protein AVEN_99230-1 [Araneus ventricosus]GBM68654.1 hypothetical protein AVEN_81215-1 [Araneus ventricosus]GBM68662.1 hypothetical protein AVEN_123887-1 [Araneus ventricosus]GBM68690.1 hypothetical protein AVEN_168823-1 [Araneus ventricosus]